ncbi:MAG: CPBP family intramembrane metalloprotease [Clostridia bacterium]|nr:CPBP family intramembrane metalloprotease [Clostridia bacterium]
MNKDRLSFIGSFMPAAVMLILIGFGYAFEAGKITAQPGTLALAAAAAFVLPMALLLVAAKEREGFAKRFRGFKPRFIPFVLFMGITLALMCFLINWAIANLFGAGYNVQHMPLSGEGFPVWQLIIASVIIPAVCEELFFRGALMPALEGESFYAAMVVSALSFAMMHGDMSNFFGPLAAGLMYGYMTYITGSVWSAVIAHGINNALTFFIGFMLEKYSVIGLWEYFLVGVTVMFFIFLYISLGMLERLIERGRVPRIRRSAVMQTAQQIFFSPGVWVLAVIFMAKVIYL